MLLFIVGFLNLLIQSILIRETYYSIANNEISTCIFLSSWLLFNGIGVLFSRKKGSFILFLTLLTLFFPLYIFISYHIQTIFNKSPGEILRIHEIFIVYYIFFAPLFFIIGGIFGRGLYEWRKEDDIKGYIRPYIFEAFGNLIGGFVFSYILLRFINFYHRFYFIFISIIFLYLLKTKKYFFYILFVIFSSVITHYMILKSVKKEFAGYKFVTLIDSNYSRYIFREREGIYSIFIDGNLSLSYPYGYNDELQHIPFLIKNDEENDILSIGLPSPSECVELMKEGELSIVTNDKNIVSYYPQKINWIFKDPTDLSPGKKYDFVILNTGLPYNISNNRFYTFEFLNLIKKYLKSNGFLVIKIPSSDVYVDPILKEINGVVLKTGLSVFKNYYFFPMEIGIFLFSDTTIVVNEEKVDEKLKRLNLHYLNSSYIAHIIRRAETFSWNISDKYKISTIKDPVFFYLFMKYYSFKFKENFITLFKFFERIPFYIFIIIFLLPLIRKSVLYNVYLVGFLGIAAEIIILFLFQSMNGSLYQYVGAIIGSFMLGIGIGAFIFEKRQGKFYLPFVFLAFSIIFLLIIIIPLKCVNTIFSFFLNLTAGFSVGITYSCSTFMIGKDKRKEAAKIYFLDLFGASFGSFFVSLFLLPIYGIQKTAIILLTVSFACLILKIIR